MAANPNQADNDSTTTGGGGNNNNNNNNTANKPNLLSSDPNTETDSFVKLVRGIKIAHLETEIKEDGETTSILGKFKDYEKDLIDMTQDGSPKEQIVEFVVGFIGINKATAILFATRLLKAYPKPQSNGM